MDPYLYILDDIESLHSPEGRVIEKRTKEPEISEKVYRWMKCQWFYSWMDKLYFQQNQLRDILIQGGIISSSEREVAFTKHEWGLIRRMWGKQRRFSARFILKERYRLGAFREMFRIIVRII